MKVFGFMKAYARVRQFVGNLNATSLSRVMVMSSDGANNLTFPIKFGKRQSLIHTLVNQNHII